MRLNLSIFAAFAAVFNAMAAPHCMNRTDVNGTSPSSTLSDPVKTYDCDGSVMCSTLKVQWCDEAVNWSLIRTDEAIYGPAGSGQPHLGACHGRGTDFGCAIVLEGSKECKRSGNDIWWDYQEIRKSGCHHCGHKRWGNGCSTTIDYYPECDWVR
ncbi:hypothetical protein M434DRAFT_37300 [Hypoxylon sp. CO27-5]|nr:hypothetical protein M434DRAFT_37300 [Hypoxylon sp. CO27-5]